MLGVEELLSKEGLGPGGFFNKSHGAILSLPCRAFTGAALPHSSLSLGPLILFHAALGFTKSSASARPAVE